MAREGVPLIVIQRQLGHSNLGITSVDLQGIDNAEIIETPRADDPRQRIPAALSDSEPDCRSSHKGALRYRRLLAWKAQAFAREILHGRCRRRTSRQFVGSMKG